MPGGEPPLLKHRRELMRNEAVKLWTQKRRAGWQVCAPPQLRKACAAACHKAIPPCSALQPEAMRLKADCAEPLAQRCCAHQPRRRPTWTTRHPARFKKHADCRPLLQQFLPIRGRVVQPGNRAAFPHAAQLVRLTDRHSSRTAVGALRKTIRPTPGMHGPRCQCQQLRKPIPRSSV